MSKLSEFKLWEKFEQTGSISDYLSYKSAARGLAPTDVQNNARGINCAKEDAHFGEFKSANERTDTQRNEGQ